MIYLPWETGVFLVGAGVFMASIAYFIKALKEFAEK